MPIYNINNKVLTHLSAQPSSGGDPDGQTFKKKNKLTHLPAQPSSGGGKKVRKNYQINFRSN